MVLIQPAEVEEVQEIKRVLSDTWTDTYGPVLPAEAVQKVTRHWHSPKTLSAEIVDPRVCFYVAKSGQGGIIGLLTAGQQGDSVIRIGRLYVLPGHQRQGIGRKLLDACAAAFPEAVTMRLEVEAQNGKGMAFYRKQGFRESSRKVEELEGIALTVVEMERELRIS